MPEFQPQHTPKGLDDFTRGYLDAAEWLLDGSTDNERGKSDRDIATGWADEAIKSATQECAAFQQEHEELLRQYEEATGRGPSAAGVDFWLTRNGHGSGFWDRGNALCLNALTAAAHACGERDTYTGDDGLIYFG